MDDKYKGLSRWHFTIMILIGIWPHLTGKHAVPEDVHEAINSMMPEDKEIPYRRVFLAFDWLEDNGYIGGMDDVG